MSAITRRTNGSENSANGFIGIRRSPLMTIVLGIVIGVLSVGSIASGDETGSDENSPKIPELGDGWKRLAKVDECWINREKKQVAVGGHVCLTKGYLEMFACSLDTKSHESVVSLNSKAFVIHTALLAIGSEPGSPAKFRPTYEPARGPVIKVEVEWIDGQGKLRRTPAQSWVRDLRTKKPMTYDWVFGGSSIWEDPASKKRFYRAEGGEVICVSNFPTAMMDLPIKSSESNDQLAFEALTESIPPRDTPVRVYLYEAKDNPDAAKEPESPK